MLANPVEMIAYLAIVVLIGTLACTAGIQKGVERVTKVMMSALFVIMIILCVRAVTLPGAGGGLAFYLVPDFSKIFGNGLLGAWDAVFAAMSADGVSRIDNIEQIESHNSNSLTPHPAFLLSSISKS